jgi:serine phosphatase RsbU (regulator of sigma subunit)
MVGIELNQDMPVTVRYHRETVEQIVQSVEERIYCAVLGPRLCGKTLLLRYIEQNLATLLGWTCVFINLEDLRATTQQAFFTDLTRQIASRIEELTGKTPPAPEDEEISSAVFRGFLSDSLETISGDLVLMIDPLEALPTDLVQALLTSLRAAHMDQQMMDYQVTVVVSGALSLATLTVGESSPFRGIARRVFVDDLSPHNSQVLILENLAASHITATKPAILKLLKATSGDIFLIRKLSQCLVDLADHRSGRILRTRDVNYIIDRFLRREVYHYAPLVEAVRLIEEDPDLLQCILLLLKLNQVHRSSLPLPLSPDLDSLYLTGVVERDPEDCYHIQNIIYHRFLSEHFSPGRVGHVLAMSGRWDYAMDYLHTSIAQGNIQSRVDLLSAAISSMYAAEDLSQAVLSLRRGLTAAFGVIESEVWICPPQEQFLRLIGPLEGTIHNNSNLNGESLSLSKIPVSADRLEARAFRQQVLLRGQEGEKKVVRAIPMKIQGQRPIGVVTIHDDPINIPGIDPRERDQQLVGFLNQAARALQAVHIRRQELILAGRMQASLLPEKMPEIPGWQIAASWRPARETSGDFYDVIPLGDDKVGIVIADVVDKGMGPALLMTISRTLIRTYADELSDKPEELLKITNQRILADIHSGIFVTLFYGVIEISTGKLTYSNAGQPPPYLYKGKQRETVAVLEKTGMALGVSEEETWYSRVVDVPPGSVLFLYTDGVLDARNAQGEYFGDRKLLNIFREYPSNIADIIHEALISGIFTFARGEAQLDDITLMVLTRDSD